MTTERDIKIVDFIEKIGCYTDTLKEIFFSDNKTSSSLYKRLAILTKWGFIKRVRHGQFEQYFYYTNRDNREPNQKRHSDCIARTYLWFLKNGYKITDFIAQEQYVSLRPDLIVWVEKDGKKEIIPAEIELSNNGIIKKIRKYEKDVTFKGLVLVSNSYGYSDSMEIINVKVRDLYKIGIL